VKTRSLLLAVVLSVCGAVGLHAQQFKVNKESDLAFGNLIQGVPLTVQPSDPGSGRFIITGPKNKVVKLSFTLPSTMAGGTAMPIAFDPLSAGYSQSSSGTSMQRFDPRTPPTITLNDVGTGYVFIGGTVRPASGQPAGSYTAPVLLVVSAP
jgi:hypothetical protein